MITGAKELIDAIAATIDKVYLTGNKNPKMAELKAMIYNIKPTDSNIASSLTLVSKDEQIYEIMVFKLQ